MKAKLEIANAVIKVSADMKSDRVVALLARNSLELLERFVGTFFP
jgi:hypothetical protein